MTHAARKFRDTKKTCHPRGDGRATSKLGLLFPEEEIRERFRVRRSHSGHVVPARIRVQAVIGSE